MSLIKVFLCPHLVSIILYLFKENIFKNVSVTGKFIFVRRNYLFFKFVCLLVVVLVLYSIFSPQQIGVLCSLKNPWYEVFSVVAIILSHIKLGAFFEKSFDLLFLFFFFLFRLIFYQEFFWNLITIELHPAKMTAGQKS